MSTSLNRRKFLRAAAAGLGVLAADQMLIACGGNEPRATPLAQPTAVPPTKAPVATAASARLGASARAVTTSQAPTTRKMRLPRQPAGTRVLPSCYLQLEVMWSDTPCVAARRRF